MTITIIVICILIIFAILLYLSWRHNGQIPLPFRYKPKEKISLLVPFHSDHGQRAINWQWLRKHWQFVLPEAELIIADNNETPFCKTAAVNDAFRRSTGDIVVILDADCYIDANVIRFCADEIRHARKRNRPLWFLPYRRLYRLTKETTFAFLASDWRLPMNLIEPFDKPQLHENIHDPSSGHWWGALIQIMPREAFEKVGGMDERFCVDTATEIFTNKGWKTYKEVQVGDMVLTLDHSTGESEWNSIQNINIFEGNHEMLSIESKTHSSLTTLNHKWPIVRRPDYRPGTGWGSQEYRRKWTISENITSEDCVPTAAKCKSLPTEAKYSDDFVRTVAWFWTEGSISRLRKGYGRNVTISQSMVVNSDKCDNITVALTQTFGQPSKFPRRGSSKCADIPRWHNRREEKNLIYILNAEAGELIQQLAPNRIPSHEFLLSLTQKQLEIFIDTSLAGDGNIRKKNYEISLMQKSPAAVEAFQFACILAGYSTSTWTGKIIPGYTYGMTGVRIRQQRQFKLIKGNHNHILHSDLVWCPTTKNGTWLARRNGKVYFTGNSGWGGEDVSFMHQLDTIYGKHRTVNAAAYHLWHPVIKGSWRATKQWIGQPRPELNTQLARRYLNARGDKRLMEAIQD